mmetsp:Transcript_92221/g.197615  ORF Transcript_92221/g.197615 Transcript_92221/m.197615 type:complete len:207 (-) Transcript_92221:214-834(-)
MISICCTAESNVQRPWRMMSMQAPMEGVRVVKGAAVEASPSCTIGVSSISSMFSAHFAAPAAKAFPCFFCTASCSFLISFLARSTTAFMAAIWPQTPTSSPRVFRAWISSSTHCCCFETKSFLFRASSSFAFFEITICCCMASFLCSAIASSASAIASAFWPAEPALAPPKPLRSAMPTSLSFKAPTSFPPSPHISEWIFSLRLTA